MEEIYCRILKNENLAQKIEELLENMKDTIIPPLKQNTEFTFIDWLSYLNKCSDQIDCLASYVKQIRRNTF